MGIQVIGPKKLRRAERETGLTIDRLVRLDNHTWGARVLREGGHVHVRIDRRTFEHADDPRASCWTTCREAGTPPRLPPLWPVIDEYERSHAA